MTKVTFLLILFLINIVGLSVAQAQTHEHGHRHEVKEELASATYKEIGRTNNQQDEHKDCASSDCCRHCHNIIFINASIRLITSAPTFLISFPELTLQVSDKFYEIIKPPLV